MSSARGLTGTVGRWSASHPWTAIVAWLAVAAAMHAAILPQLGVLATYAALLLSLPTWRLRLVLSG